jgi:sulfoxide reductase catalytic subunit YedY
VTRIPSSDITDQRFYLNRRAFIASALAAAGASAFVNPELHAQQPAAHGRKLATVKSPLSGSETPNKWEHLTTYNNFYEFGTSKSDPALNARGFKPREPWTIAIEGECARRGTITLEDVLKGQTLEESHLPAPVRRRLVDGHPWVGFPLASLIKRCEPTSKAAFVEFTTLLDPGQMPGQKSDVLEWPYVEGLRMDEAMHPLTILAVGLYGETLPNQNGAPLRLVVPWKYGFKGIKSIVKVRFLAKQPSRHGRSLGPRPTASTPTSTPRSLIRDTARPLKRGSRRCSRRRERWRSTATETRWQACTRAWISSATTDR